MKKLIFPFLFLLFFAFHLYKVNQIEKNTALEILDDLISMEREVKPDESNEDDEKIYLSPRKYARRIAIMDCEALVCEKYKLWK